MTKYLIALLSIILGIALGATISEKQIREEMQQYKDIKSFSDYLKEDKKAKAAFDELKDCIIINHTKERIAENKERYMLVWRFSCIKQIQ